MKLPTAEELPLDPPLDFMRRLWRLNQSLEKMSSRMERELGVTAQQRLVLRTVGLNPEITPGMLAKTLHLDPGTISAAIAKLVERRLLRKTRDAGDARRYFLSLTRGGKVLTKPHDATVEGVVAELLESEGERDLRAARRLLERLSEALESSAAKK